MQLTDLPIDIIVLLFPHLDAKEFLAFTSCTPSFLPYRQEPSYWRGLTRSTFRIPPQPLLETDGAHWQRLYKNLRTQTKVFTWGSNSRGNLGHYVPVRTPGRRLGRARGVVGWPHEMHDMKDVGVVADVQCGGWSTVLLNSNGQLWATGVLNGEVEWQSQRLLQLRFPPAFPATSSSRYEPSTAVQQYSVGRCRALALSDDGKLWQWPNFNKPAQIVKFFTLDTDPTRSSNGDGKVTKVVAGWSASSAYVTGAGIVVWWAEPDDDNEDGAETDGFMVQHFTIPGTAFRRAYPDRVTKDSLDAAIGEVTDYVVLADYVVFMTDTKKLFAYHVSEETTGRLATPVELNQFYSNDEPVIKSVQGSHTNFGVFTTTGTVWIGTNELLDAAWESHTTGHSPNIPSPRLIPALQSSSVISLAFGDYHFHALHATGAITSYGHESEACGSLGLGDRSFSHLRGLFFPRRNTGDGELHTPTWGDGRRTVWFEEEKRQWLEDTCQKGATNEASQRALRLTADLETTKLVGEWFERGGRDWSKGPGGTQADQSADDDDDDDDGVGAYFTLKITAAGRSSAALVLVNEEKARRVRAKYVVQQPILPDVPESSPQGSEGASDAAQPQSQTLLRNVPGYVFGLGRWMLGLDARDAREELQRSERHDLSAEELKKARQEEIRYDSTYVWDQQPFPRLRYPGGDVMPGEVEITEWKGGEPDFSEG